MLEPRRRFCALVACLAAVAAFGCDRPVRPNAPFPNHHVVLISIETTRADFVGCYGSDLGLTPVVDSLATVGTRIELGYSTSSWTRPSIGSLWTGSWPERHGAVRDGVQWPLREDLPTLAETLSNAGYATFAAVTNANLSPSLGFDRGFDEYFYALGARADTLHARTVDWLSRRPPERPVFLALHYDEPHGAFFQAKLRPLVEGRSRADVLEACAAVPDAWRIWATELYGERIREADAAVGRLLAAVTAELGPQTVVVVVSDHGEEWFDHGGLFHGHSLHEELVRVPFVFAYPGASGISRTGPAQLHDVFPTLAGLVGASAPETDGRDLTTLLLEGTPAPASVFCTTDMTRPLASVRTGNLKRIRHLGDGDAALHDLREDPYERQPLAEQTARADSLDDVLDEHLDALPPVESGADVPGAEADDRLLEELAALGYVGTRDEGGSVRGSGRPTRWSELYRQYRFVRPDDERVEWDSTARAPTSAPPRVVLGSRAGDLCRFRGEFTSGWVVLDRHDWSGEAVVELDGNEVARVDLFAPGPDAPPLLVPLEAQPGSHVVEVRATGEKRAAAAAAQVLLAGFVLARD